MTPPIYICVCIGVWEYVCAQLCTLVHMACLAFYMNSRDPNAGHHICAESYLTRCGIFLL